MHHVVQRVCKPRDGAHVWRVRRQPARTGELSYFLFLFANPAAGALGQSSAARHQRGSPRGRAKRVGISHELDAVAHLIEPPLPASRVASCRRL